MNHCAFADKTLCGSERRLLGESAWATGGGFNEFHRSCVFGCVRGCVGLCAARDCGPARTHHQFAPGTPARVSSLSFRGRVAVACAPRPQAVTRVEIWPRTLRKARKKKPMILVGVIGFEGGISKEVGRRNPADEWYKNPTAPRLSFLIARITKADCPPYTQALRESQADCVSGKLQKAGNPNTNRANTLRMACDTLPRSATPGRR